MHRVRFRGLRRRRTAVQVIQIDSVKVDDRLVESPKRRRSEANRAAPTHIHPR